MCFRLLLLWGACALAPVVAHAGEPAPGPLSIALRPNALVAHARITLADVASVSASGASIIDIAGIELGQAPRVGYVERVSRAQIEHALRRRMNLDTASVTWSGAPSVAVRVQAQTVRAATLSSKAVETVTARFEEPGSTLGVVVLTPSSDLEVPVGELAVQARPIAQQALAARMAVWLDIFVGGTLYRSVVVPVGLTVQRPAYVARRALAQGAVASAADFTIADVDVAGVQALPVSSNHTTFRLRQPVDAGQILAKNAVTPADKVLRGDQVRLVVRHGQIGVETDGVAVAEAEPGQLLAVRPRGGSATVTGRLGLAGTVNIE